MKCDLHLPVVEALISTPEKRKRSTWRKFRDILYSDNTLCILQRSQYLTVLLGWWKCLGHQEDTMRYSILWNLCDVTWSALKKSKLTAGKRKIKSVKFQLTELLIRKTKKWEEILVYTLISIDRPVPRKEQATISLRKMKAFRNIFWVVLLCYSGAVHGA